MKNSPAIKRAAVCVALAALSLIGAGWFVARPVAGQEATPQTLRGAAALERLKQEGQYESLQAAMDQARFSVSIADATPLGRAAWRAPNAVAGYDAYVTEEGVSLVVGQDAILSHKETAMVSLHLRSIGYGEALQSVGPGEVSADKQTINIMRGGGLREWFVNGEDGLEHGFTLAEPLGARQQGAPLRLALQVGAGWRAVTSDDGKLVTLRGPNDEAVEYGKLVVRDKLGRNIAARLTVADEQVVIEVEDHDAAYPLTIDPLFTLQQRLLATDGTAGDYLGHAVALSGNTALVGAPFDNLSRGAAYVFVRNGGKWTQQARLTAQDGASFDHFGYAVALDGDYALIGTVYGPGGANPDQGAAYVFVRGGTTWSQQARLNAGDGGGPSHFGAAVALDGQTALIGAHQSQIRPSASRTGAAYVFTRNGAAWTQQARLSASDSAADDQFGFSVALDGDTALVGAPADNVGANANQGSAYLFTRSGASWTQRQRLDGSRVGPAANDQFGIAVALSGEKALIGAHLYGSDDHGEVFDFRRDATGWTHGSLLSAPNPTAGGHFGVSVALDADTAVVGAALGPFAPGADQRSAYVFVQRGDYELVRRFGPELGSANDGFGYAVALDGDTVLVGAYRGDATANDQGAAYVFTLRDSRSVEQQKLTANDGGAGDNFGNVAALDADTLVVGADGDDIGVNADQGSVYVFTRSGAVWTLQQKITAADGAAGDLFGWSVALRGDTLVVGASYDDIGGKADQGSAYIFTRNGTVWTQRQKLIAAGTDGLANDRFGSSVALSGGAVAVGAPGVEYSRGAVYVFTLNGAVWKEQAKLTANDGAAGDVFGYAVALDGGALVVGAPQDAAGANAKQGSAYVFTRSGAAQPVWTLQQKLTASDGEAGGQFGVSVAVDKDTAAVGANGMNAGRGAAYVFTRYGSTQPVWAQRQKLAATDGEPFDNFGGSVALSDGTLVAGASGDTVGANGQQGSAYVYTRIADWFQRQKLIAGDGAKGDYFGGWVALSGDTLAVGARQDTIGENPDQGSVYVFVSPPCPALTLAPAGLPIGRLGAIYNQQFTGSGGSGAGDYQFAVSGGELPPGLELKPLGLLTGKLTATGTYRFTITVTYILSGCSASRDYTLTVTPPCPTLTLNPATLPNGEIGAEYNLPITAGAGKAPYSYKVTAGALPGGLNLSDAGALAGKPVASGSYNFTVTATDANGCQIARAYTLVIRGCFYTVAPTPQSFSATAQTGNVTVATTASCAWTAQSANSWITLSDSGGKGVGTVRFTVAANSGAKRTGAINIAGQTVTITQAAPPADTPRLTRLSPNAARGGTNGFTLTVTGSAFSASQRVEWNGVNCETSFVSDTQLRAVIPAAFLTNEGTAAVAVVDTANGARSNLDKFRILGAVAHASAASYDTVTLAPDSVVAAFGADLATEVRVATSLPLPTELAGTTVIVRDSQNTTIRAPLFFVAPNQVNYLMPAGLADGVAIVTITNGRGASITSLTEISAVTPGLFSANASGGGAAAAVALRIRANGEQAYEPVARYDPQTQKFALLPIDLSNAAEQVYLILFGTGIRRRGDLKDVMIEIGVTQLPVAYAGAAPGAGLDQVNVLLPASLRGRGEQTVTLRVSGEASNGVSVRFQ
ncbi:MAG: putative Ig domain-containing protein [Blastocatellales bacterium]